MKATDGFAHLHVHTEYSMLDGAAALDRLVSRVADLGQSAVAITDHGNLHGAYKFHAAALAANIKPIIGSEFYVAPGHRLNSERVREDGFSGGGSYSHLTVLARNAEGLSNLYRLSSSSYSEGFYSKPRTDTRSLAAMAGGLSVATGCLSGELAVRIKNGQLIAAEDYLEWGKQTFGEHFYVEVMDHGFERETVVNEEAIRLARRHNIPLLATNDSHYVTSSDYLVHDAMLCVQTRKKLADPDRMSFDGSGYYLKSRLEMELTTDLPLDAMDNTLTLAESVEGYGDLFKHVLRMPVSGYDDPDQELYNRCAGWDGVYWDRFMHEFKIITKLEFTDYFLVLADVLAVARQRGVDVGPGRGSAGGSLVAFTLGITGLDPIEYGLSFERFLNADRVSLPDIDVDIPDDQRDNVVAIAKELYGQDRATRIGTIGTIKSRAALKDSARVLGYPYRTGEDLCGLLPLPIAGRAPTLSDIPVPHYPVDGEDVIMPLALSLEGLARQASQHAAGVVISPGPLTEVLPTWVNKAGKGTTTTQWDMHAVEELGLVKYDFLGLANLAIIRATIETYDLGLRFGVSLGTKRWECNDTRTYEMLSRGDSTGVFQLDSLGMQRLLKRLQPGCIDDIAAVLALYRPGPMGVNAHWEYADRKNSRKPVVYPHPEFRDRLRGILGPTYGLIVYQEQVTATLVEICGYTVNEADSVRKAMGKKDRDLLATERQHVLGTTGFSREALQTLWDTLVPFADYAFNKSHAIGYAIVSYWTAYLKANFPGEYFATVLTKEENKDKLREYMAEVRRLGIPILPPDVNTSDVAWTATADGIRYGLATIKGVGETVIKALQTSRPYRSWDDFLRRAQPSVAKTNTVHALLSAGALDSLGSREGISLVFEGHLEEARTEREERGRGEVGLRTRRFAVPSKPVDYPWRKAQEREVLGLSISERPLLIVIPEYLDQTDWDYIKGAVMANPGLSQLIIKVGSWKMPFGLVDSAGILRSLKPIGGVEDGAHT